ncbi:hypothetical protein PSN45_003637 [Yamadazyma tenuis]|uniref:Rab-GAP TBC domain-containing protein n=1 Tax=Candida tenuis (strain ATCC 10573 / BCRC 21748 / CBS 615 / JCM 9827 / NBRC 10315 / NRRL Y-1498 / VKM Y-70) TaxID=590646 RepID=G3AZI1_CANTC|nr:uncharacterized protein CANTEDRAFT_117968 [Yamadazyma tenuis ATCC 10573]EGV65583.1 hypothetical protein CANTEDRAFT_117968 [Yamadazyma tenuis ATCC 10573]WEJ96101.1 hypothetical protein PSN45_003637 [Yamadazyma tenuis]
MSDYESLLEFEDSLQTSTQKDTSITLGNLEAKIEYNLVVPSDHSTTSPEIALEAIFNGYDYSMDEFTSCNICGKPINTNSDCCLKFIEQSKLSSSLESSYWRLFLNSPTRTINTLPHYSQLLFLEQGIPFQLRPTVWKKLFLIHYNNEIPEACLLVYKNFQHSYNSETSDQISKDLNRTFPTVSFFLDERNIKQLETVLNVYANYDVELGYCQGLLFLVGTLFYQFKDPQLTFHSLITIMESEVELHDIFTQELMSSTLNKWYSEFTGMLSKLDNELYVHMSSFVDMKVFLYQWWLSFMSSHTPDFSIINRILDFCLIQGWKIGMFKISAGLLLVNKPILMSLTDGEEEVVYQHLLYECKWGLALKDINHFFGELLMNFDPSFFNKNEDMLHINKPMKTHKRTQSSMIDKFRSLNISSYSLGNTSNNSIFSKKIYTTVNNDTDSVYSEVTIDSSSSGNSKFADYLKIPSPFANSEISRQNKTMKDLLIKCMANLDDEELIKEIIQVIA